MSTTVPPSAEFGLASFLPPVRAWFEETFGRPTPPQSKGWPAIQRGEHTLILAPTGSGKTLAAFLWGIDRLFRELLAQQESSKKDAENLDGVRIIYIAGRPRRWVWNTRRSRSRCGPATPRGAIDRR